jgi:RNA polymerase sigma factor (sigma-70 family)
VGVTVRRLSKDEARAPSPHGALWDVYVSKRGDLVRLFAARLQSRSAAEDLLQDLYLKISSLDQRTPIDNPSAFLYRTAVNLMLDRLRSERRTDLRDRAWHDSRRVRVGDADVADEPSPEQSAAGRERLRRLLDAVAGLPPQTRRAFELHKFEGCSHAETARRLGVSSKTVEKQVSDALRRLTAKLAEFRR